MRSGNRTEVVRLLQLAGPTVKILLNRTITFWGDTALHLAYRRGDTEMVRLLLSYGADPTVLNDSDQPAIPAGDMVRARLPARSQTGRRGTKAAHAGRTGAGGRSMGRARPGPEQNMHQLHGAASESMSFSRLGVNSLDSDSQALLGDGAKAKGA